jgi:hypothetical protein
MWSKYAAISFALLCILSLSTSCRKDEPINPSDDRFADTNEMIVYETDSTEWHVRLFATGKLYAEAVQVEMPDPWQLPTREDAQILKTLTYPSDERFVTSDGYTFGMPSASVSKAGQKTQYSVLGLWKRKTVITMEW